ncbi:MAG: hypothetical protein R3293_24575, partial [Candidatus Promineifilaceae bacterium]|nr:hypothetical protein [Candidatus Promineifilaceae bacterium]
KNGIGSHKVYGANLIGSACGSLGSLLILTWFGGPGGLLCAALLALFAALIFAWGTRTKSKKFLFPGQVGVILILIVLGSFSLVRPPDWLEQRLSPYKALSTLKLALDTEHVGSFSDAAARLDLLESSIIHVMPGLSLSSPAGIPRQAALLVDGDNLMPITITVPDAHEIQVLADYTPQTVAQHLRPNSHTLVIGAGTGLDVLISLAAGSEEVTAVEENEHIIGLMSEHFGQSSGNIYADERVNFVNETGRVFAGKQIEDDYDLIVVALTGQHRPVQSGAYSLTEDYSTTIEAMEDLIGILDEHGLLVVTRWLQTPPSESARAFATLVSALENSGRNPAGHLVAYRSLRTMTILAAENPFSAIELEQIRTLLSERGFDAVYLPDLQPEEANLFNILPEPVYSDIFNQILDNPRATFENYRFEIRPATDNHPFFFHFFKWRQTPEIVAGFGRSWQPFGGSGFFVLVALLLLVSLAAALFIIGPLLIWRQKRERWRTAIPHWQLRVFLYFAALGLAFLFVEMPMAQQFILLLGKPVIALAVVIFSVLLFSGLGSLWSRKFSLSLGPAVLMILAALYPFILQKLAPIILAWPDWGRMIFAILFLAPLGFFMGLPFASGLRVVERQTTALVPWAWAINASFSVISSVVAVMIALTWGFAAVLWLGAAAYGVAFLAFRRLGHR